MLNRAKKPEDVRRRRRGQTLVEAALVVAGVLVPLSFGIMQFGIIINATNSLTHIAREGGRYAAVHGTELNADAAIKDYVQTVAAGTAIKPADLPDPNIEIFMANGAPRASGNAITVKITYQMRKKVFVPKLFPFMDRLTADYVTQSTFVLE